MPIRKENKLRYPKNWKTDVRPRIMARAMHNGHACCEHCLAPNHMWVERTNGFADSWRISMEGKGVRIVLTIAHMNDVIEDCSDENLRALCQLCHNRYDQPKRQEGMRLRRIAERASGDLFRSKEPAT